MLENVVEVKEGEWHFVEEREMSGALVSVIEVMDTDVQTRCASPTLSKEEERVAVVRVEEEEMLTLVSVSVPDEVTSNGVFIFPEPSITREIPVKLASPVPTLTNVADADVMLNFGVALLDDLLTVSVSVPTVMVVSDGEYVPLMQIIVLPDTSSICPISHALWSVVHAV